MTNSEIKEEFKKFGTVQACRASKDIFTLLIIAADMNKITQVSAINELTLKLVGKFYTQIEAFSNDENHYLIVLRKSENND